MIIRSLVIDGTPSNSTRKSRFKVWVNGKELWLTYREFCHLTILATSRLLDEGWVHESEFGRRGNHKQVLSIIRTTCKLEVENSYGGFYKLQVDPRKIFFNHKMLAEFPDEPIRDAVENVKESV